MWSTAACSQQAPHTHCRFIPAPAPHPLQPHTCSVVQSANSRAVMPPRAPQSTPSQLKGWLFSLCHSSQSTSWRQWGRGGEDKPGRWSSQVEAATEQVGVRHPAGGVHPQRRYCSTGRLQVAGQAQQDSQQHRPAAAAKQPAAQANAGQQQQANSSSNNKAKASKQPAAYAHLVETVLPLLSQLRHLAKSKAHGLQDAQALVAELACGARDALPLHPQPQLRVLLPVLRWGERAGQQMR